MDPELKEYLDAWFARRERLFDKLADAFAPPETRLRPADHGNSTPTVDITGGVFTPVQASSDTAEPVLASAGLAQPSAPVPASGEPPAVAVAVPINSSAMVPATCSTEGAAHVVSAATTTPTLLPWVSISSSSTDTSASNGMVSNELRPPVQPSSLSSSLSQFTAWEDVSSTAPTPCAAVTATVSMTGDTNRAVNEQWSASAPAMAHMAVVDCIPVLAAAAACAGNLDDQATGGVASTPASSSTAGLVHDIGGDIPESLFLTPCGVIPSSNNTPPLAPTPSPATSVSNGVVPSELTFDIDDEHEVGIVPAASPVCIPWTFTRPWLEPVPPRPPDPWSWSAGAWLDSRLGASMTVESAVNTVRLCNKAEEVPAYKLSDEVTRQDEVQQQPWPPPLVFCENSLRDELQEIFGNAASICLHSCSSDCPRGITLATPESQVLHLLGNFSYSVSCGMAEDQCSAKAKWSFNALLLRVHEWAPDIQCVQHACVNSYVLYWHERYTIGVQKQVLVSGSPNSFGVADLLEDAYQLKSTNREQGLTLEHLVQAVNHQKIEAKLSDTTSGHNLDHRSRLGFVIIGVPATWPHFSMVQITELTSKDISFHTASMLSVERWLLQSTGDLHPWFGSAMETTVKHNNFHQDISVTVVPEFQQLNLWYYYRASKMCPVALLELQGSTYNLFPGGACAAHKVQNSRTFTSSNHLQKGTYKAWHLNNPVVKRTHDDSCYGGEGKEHAQEPLFLYSICALAPMKKILSKVWFTCVLRMCTRRIRVKSKRKANQQWKMQWDPGGCLFILSSSEKRWSDPLHCYAHLKWSLLQIAGAFRIRLVTWTVDGLEFSMGFGQAPFQGGRDSIRAAFSDQIHVSHDYYIACANQILFDYDYYLNQAYYFDKICNDIICYHEDCHSDSSKTKEVHMPWDPGKSNFRHTTLRLRLGVKPNFKEGGMLGPSTLYLMLGFHCGLATMGRDQPLTSLHIHSRRQRMKASKLDQKTAAAEPSFHLGSVLPSSSCLYLCVSV